MQKGHSSTQLACLAILTATAIASCSQQDKVDQCSNLIAVLNQGEPLVNKFETESKNLEKSIGESKDLTEFKANVAKAETVFNRIVGDLNQHVEAVRTVELTDAGLKGFQQQYVTSGQEMGQQVQEIGQVFTQVSKIDGKPEDEQQLEQLDSQFQAASNELDTAGKKSDKVVEEINNYCAQN
jgi:predicted component of type VI protein secretion system